MRERAAYSRVYWEIIDDPKFATIYDNNDHLATWLRLLIAADQAWPASAHVPATAKRSSVSALAVAGLIDVMSGRYRVRGLDSEREKRAEAARIGGKASAVARTNEEQTFSKRSETVPPLGEPSRDEPRQDETSRDSARVAREPIDRIVDVWMSVKYRVPSEKQRAFLFAYLQTFDVSGEARAERLILSNPQDPIDAMKRDLAEFRAERVATLAEEVKAPPPRRRPGLPQSTREILAEMKKLESERGAA
jgi:hypothetical protein